METRTAELLHDLRTPLQLICGCARMLKTELDCDGSASDYVEMLLNSAAEMQQMLNSALEYGRAGETPLRLAVCDLVSEARSVISGAELQARERGIRLVFRCGVRRLETPADAGKYRRILRNLLANALRFTPPGGCITVTLAARDGRAELRVTDTGRGVPADRLEEIFRRGVTEGGLGYGLPVSREFARAMGGELRAEACPDGGAFRLTLPVREPGMPC